VSADGKGSWEVSNRLILLVTKALNRVLSAGLANVVLAVCVMGHLVADRTEISDAVEVARTIAIATSAASLPQFAGDLRVTLQVLGMWSRCGICRQTQPLPMKPSVLRTLQGIRDFDFHF